MIILDTHIWVAYVDDPGSLPKPSLEAIRGRRDPVGISSISVWEVFMLERRGRLELRIPARVWVEKCERLALFHFIPVDNTIARLAVELPDPLHADPADRIIIATALSLGATLVTRDRKIIEYPHVKTLRLSTSRAGGPRES
ncbi:MAG: type II toxin-antitoxin system VapC family toxin [Spirochaetes bacterium]|nr:type II toxin-antitoxin system VapC family toxin [Spirochaetota bacterium]